MVSEGSRYALVSFPIAAARSQKVSLNAVLQRGAHNYSHEDDAQERGKRIRFAGAWREWASENGNRDAPHRRRKCPRGEPAARNCTRGRKGNR
jgi:hypothetical protein